MAAGGCSVRSVEGSADGLVTMQPERSFGRNFSRLGRLENRWAAALAQTDSARALKRLRAVYRRFERQPGRAAHLWLPFQDSVLAARFADLLTDHDFERLSAVGRQSAIAARTSLTEAWSPLIEASLARHSADGRRRAYQLLTGLYWSSLPSDAERRQAAAALAGFEAVGEEQLAVYADVAAQSRPVPEVMKLIDRILQVGFSDRDARLSRAYSLAMKLGDRVPRTDAVFAVAIGELLLKHRPHLALDFFQTVRQQKASHAEALRGVVAAHMHAREFSAAVSAASVATSVNQRCAELLTLCRQLAWLDAPQSLTEIEVSVDSPPWSAAQLTEIAPGRDAGPWLEYAIGRSHLLDGKADQARRFLAPLPARGLADADVVYHLAWANLLCQDAESIRKAFAAAAGQPGSWAIGCVLQDAEPGQAKLAHAPFVPASLQAVAVAREALAAQGAAASPVDLTTLRPGDVTRPDLFEALRTALGVAVARDDDPALGSLIRQPLFSRLPAAERLLWMGLAVRSVDPDRARRALRRSLALGRKRAALILAVDALDDGRPADARELLNGVPGPKAALALAWTDARTGALAQAVERFEDLAQRGSAHAEYALGLLALRDAAGAWSRERAGRAKSRAEQAVKALARASRRAPYRFETTSLARAAGLLATTTPDGDGALPWQEFAAQPWTARQLGFGELVLTPEATDSPLLQSISRWAVQPRSVLRECPPEYVALADALVRVALLTTDTAICEQVARLLAGLAERVPSPEIRTAARRAAACADLRVGDETFEASSDPLIALAATHAVLGGDYGTAGDPDADRAEAVRLLRSATDQSSHQRADARPEYAALAALLGDALGHGRLPSPLPLDLPARAESALALAATMGAGADEEAAAHVLLRALRTADVNDLVDLERALAVLSIHVARQSGDKRTGFAAALAPTILRAAENAGEPGGLDNHPVARFATVVGEFEAADKLWLRALDDADADFIRLPLLRTEYGRFLNHRAVLAHLGGRRDRLLEYLRTAAPYIPEPAERILRQLEADERVQKLLSTLFPGSPILGRQRPGRYSSFDTLIASNPDLRAAIDAGPGEQITGQWKLAVAGRAGGGDGGIELWHTAAVLSRENALAQAPKAASAVQAGISATALWMLLLAEPKLSGLFEDRPHAAEADALLRTHLVDELLVSQKARLTESLAQKDLHAVRAHMYCLDNVRQGTAATRRLAASAFTEVAAHIGTDAGFVPISERAEALLVEWGAERIAAGRLRLSERAPSKRRARAVVADYGAAIEEVEIVAQLGLRLNDVLRVALEWHTGWLRTTHGTQDKRVGEHVIRSATRFVDILAPMYTPGDSHVPEVRALAEHYIERGVFNLDAAPDDSIRMLEHAQIWDPVAERVPDLLWDAYMACLEVARKHLDRGSLPDAEVIMGLVPDGWRMLSTELNNRGVAKMSRVYDTVISFHRRRIELTPAQRANFVPELLDAERLLLEAGRLDPTETGIGENLEQVRELMKYVSPGPGGAYR
ncbi:hypothetical protein KDK95_05445 [Actinospica sp. MGRD01-02]|uniref:Uncharacterized protein n=1 Tax=Actinospica acidithermotolerans TaxID=2828514 RepID=A0A941E867_9ACTN|nr:hypothetical protein [Actinospica acidithermotolerans]MBR7825743.1 hypothetical protein [Actinospica acidithermotolerans]